LVKNENGSGIEHYSHYKLRDTVSYDPRFFRVANHATKILTGGSLLSAIKEYGKTINLFASH